MNIILLAISAAFVNNVILVQFLGICPFLGVSKQIKTAAGMGGAVIFVMAISSTVTSLIYYFILEPLNIAYLNTIVFILVIAALVQFVEMFLKKSVPALYKALGVYLPLITGIFSAVGFAVALILMAGIREKLDKNDSIPESFKGTPIVLISAGLMAIAFAGLAGLI